MPPITCDLCQAEPASIMQTNVANGDVVTVGDSCILTFLLTVSGEIVGAMPDEMAAAYGAVIKPLLDKLSGIPAIMAAATAVNGDGQAPADALELDEDPVTGDMVPLDAGDSESAPAAPAGGN